MEASHKTHRPHIKVGKDAEEEEEEKMKNFIDGDTLFTVGCCQFFCRIPCLALVDITYHTRGGGGNQLHTSDGIP